MLTITHDQIPFELARQAHAGTSFVPETRARQVQEDYVSYFEAIVAEFDAYDQPDDVRECMWKELEAYRSAYIVAYTDVLRAKSRCISTMITGASNFPTSRAQNANNTADRKTSEFLSWVVKSLARLRKKYDPKLIANRPIETGDPEAITLTREKLQAAQALQDRMKKANRICRSPLDNDAKISKLMALGWPQAVATQLLVPDDFTGRAGFAPFKLTNNNATIRRLKQRMAELEKEELRRENPTEDVIVGDVIMTENVAENRLQILFSEKPNEQMRSWLKSHGFVFSYKNDAWQRKLTENARNTGKLFMRSHELGEFDD